MPLYLDLCRKGGILIKHNIPYGNESTREVTEWQNETSMLPEDALDAGNLVVAIPTEEPEEEKE